MNVTVHAAETSTEQAARRAPAAAAAHRRRGQRRVGAVAVPPARRARPPAGRHEPRLGWIRPKDAPMLERTSLAREWRVRLARPAAGTPDPVLRAATAAGLPATVPGCVHTDLLAAGLLPDPYLDRNEDDAGTGWGGRDWTLRDDAAGPRRRRPHERVDLVFDGLDTVADGRAGRRRGWGAPPTCTARYRFDVTRRSRRAATPLTVRFDVRLRAYAERCARGRRPARTPTPSRSSTSARWPATSAGTGGRRWSPRGSGGRCGSNAGRPPGWPRCARW